MSFATLIYDARYYRLGVLNILVIYPLTIIAYSIHKMVRKRVTSVKEKCYGIVIEILYSDLYQKTWAPSLYLTFFRHQEWNIDQDILSSFNGETTETRIR